MIFSLKPTQFGPLRQLLEDNGLPFDDFPTVTWRSLVGYREQDQLIGAAGLEQCHESVLLRSVVVAADSRGRGIGEQLVGFLHDVARTGEVDAIWLLTTDADRYFSERFGYQPVGREQVPPGIRESRQFSGLCPDTATLMCFRIQQQSPI